MFSVDSVLEPCNVYLLYWFPWNYVGRLLAVGCEISQNDEYKALLMRTRIAHMIMKLESYVHEEGGRQFLNHVGATLTLTQSYLFHI